MLALLEIAFEAIEKHVNQIASMSICVSERLEIRCVGPMGRFDASKSVFGRFYAVPEKRFSGRGAH